MLTPPPHNGRFCCGGAAFFHDALSEQKGPSQGWPFGHGIPAGQTIPPSVALRETQS